MKFFIDGADIAAIQEYASMGLVDGVTTNPSIIAKSGRKFHDVIKEICDIIDGPVSAEVMAPDAAGMITEGKHLAKIAKNVCIKVPLTPEGLKACYALRQENIMVNVTLCFSAPQALVAAKAGATFISPFIGRLDDIGENGMELIRSICQIYANYPDIQTQVLAASIRTTRHVIDAAELGADVATIPASVFKQMFQHPLTDKGMEIFQADWKKTGQNIIG
jgi:transaldolase